MDTGWNSDRKTEQVVEEMQLWKKNFLVIYGIFLVMICGGLLILDGYISRNETDLWIENARNDEKSIYYLAAGLKGEDMGRMAMYLADAADRYEEAGIYIQVSINGNIVIDYFPRDLKAERLVQIKKSGKERFLVIQESGTDGSNMIEVNYAKWMGELSSSQTRRLWIFCGIGLLFAGMMGVFLYYTMRYINRPVNQIAHELRTPLTGIRGYAEYLMMGKITREDSFFAARQIVDSAKRLEDIMEKLLIMGNVRDGAIHIGRIDMKQMISGLEEKYPKMEVDCRLEFLNGDETLVSCLIDNLISNAARAGERVKLTLDEGGIHVWNDGEPIDEKLLKEINKGQDISAKRMGKHGYGIQVCREIAREHGWKLKFLSSREEGTEVFCQISASYRKILYKKVP